MTLTFDLWPPTFDNFILSKLQGQAFGSSGLSQLCSSPAKPSWVIVKTRIRVCSLASVFLKFHMSKMLMLACLCAHTENGNMLMFSRFSVRCFSDTSHRVLKDKNGDLMVALQEKSHGITSISRLYALENMRARSKLHGNPFISFWDNSAWTKAVDGPAGQHRHPTSRNTSVSKNSVSTGIWENKCMTSEKISL